MTDDLDAVRRTAEAGVARARGGAALAACVLNELATVTQIELGDLDDGTPTAQRATSLGQRLYAYAAAEGTLYVWERALGVVDRAHAADADPRPGLTELLLEVLGCDPGDTRSGRGGDTARARADGVRMGAAQVRLALL